MSTERELLSALSFLDGKSALPSNETRVLHDAILELIAMRAQCARLTATIDAMKAEDSWERG